MMHLGTPSLALLFYLAIAPVIKAQQTETSTVILPASTVLVATTITSYSPDTTVTVTPTNPPSPEYTVQSDLIDAVLNSTNFFRWEHNASFLAWNDSLAAYATNWASQCVWEHSHGGPGENLARGYPDVGSAVDAWGDERALYSFSPPTGFTEATGHFTQLVWKSTQTVGCAAKNCAGENGVQGWFLVCEYWPAGNIVGTGSDINAWFEANVQSQINDGQGFNIASATAGASGVGTSWATSVGLPTVVPSSGGNGRQVVGRIEILGGIAALFGVIGL